MKLKVLLTAAVFMLGAAQSAFAGKIVYSGLDTIFHTDNPEALVLLENEVNWAGADGAADAPIAYTGFGEIGTELANIGFINVTQIAAGDLESADLSAYDVLVVNTCCGNGDGPGLVAAAGNIMNFVNSGGGLVVEAHVLDDPYSWVWVPYADLIGHSGANNIGTEDVVIVEPGHPVMAGLTDDGLSDWGFSIHSTFDTPEAAGFVTLATDPAGTPNTIAMDSAFVATPVPTLGLPAQTLMILIFAGLGLLVFSRRRLA